MLSRGQYFGTFVPMFDGGFPAPSLPVPLTTGYYPAEISPTVPTPYGSEYSSGFIPTAKRASRGRACDVPRSSKRPTLPSVKDTIGASLPYPERRSRRQPTAADSDANNDTNETGNGPCQFYLRTGTCAFGIRCKFYHPPNQQPPTLNRHGYPIRKGEKSCPYYMKHGHCGFGATCKFHHPPMERTRARMDQVNMPGPIMPMIGDYGWPTAPPVPPPAQGWYATTPVVIPSPQMPMMPPPPPPAAIFPPYHLYAAMPVVSENKITGRLSTSPNGYCTSSGTNNHCNDEDESSSVGYSDEDRCRSY